MAEVQIEDVLFAYTKNGLEGFNLNINNNHFLLTRQLVIGSYGRADLVGFSRKPSNRKQEIGKYDLFIDIFELKSGGISHETLAQALRYAKGISEYLKIRKSKINAIFTLYLIGHHVSREMAYLSGFLSNDKMNIILYEYTAHPDLYIKFTEIKDKALKGSGFSDGRKLNKRKKSLTNTTLNLHHEKLYNN